MPESPPLLHVPASSSEIPPNQQAAAVVVQSSAVSALVAATSAPSAPWRNFSLPDEDIVTHFTNHPEEDETRFAGELLRQGTISYEDATALAGNICPESRESWLSTQPIFSFAVLRFRITQAVQPRTRIFVINCTRSLDKNFESFRTRVSLWATLLHVLCDVNSRYSCSSLCFLHRIFLFADTSDSDIVVICGRSGLGSQK